MKRDLMRDLIIFAVASIPVITILASLEQSPFEYTLSMMGNWFGADERLKFIVWGIITSIILTSAIYYIYKKTEVKNKDTYNSLLISGIFLMLTVFTPTPHRTPIPYEIRSFPIDLHNTFGILFITSLAVSLYLFSKYISQRDKRISSIMSRFLTIILGGTIVMIIIFGMTGIFEIFFFLSLSIALIVIERIAEKMNQKSLNNAQQ